MKSITILSFGLLSVLNSYASSECAATISAFPPEPSTGCCGVDASSSTKQIRGREAEVDQYPWLTLIEYLKGDKLKALCGGTLISGKYVLTVAYCVSGPITSSVIPKNIILGEYDVNHEGPDCVEAAAGGKDCSDGAMKIPIEKIIPHPQYEPKGTSRRHDIALVRMTEMAPYTDFIRPICLPTSDITLKKDPLYWLKLAGWGTAFGPSSVKLQVDLPFVSLEKCQLAYSSPGRNISLWKGQLCAGGEKGKDSCKGDGGMPLMNENGEKYEVVGLVSFGSVPCGMENVPSVYTNVYEYKSWITSNIAAYTHIRLGEYDKTQDGPDCVDAGAIGEDCTDGETSIPIEKIIPHPQYDAKHGARGNDIALIRMKDPAPYTDFIRPICLLTEDVSVKIEPITFRLAGWETFYGPSDVKMYVDLPFVTQDECQRAFSARIPNFNLGEGQLYAGGVKGKDSCLVDGGLPLMYGNGLVSFGFFACGSENIASVYTNDFQYSSCISSNITP